MGKAENYVEDYLVKRVKALRGMCLKFTSSITGVPDRIIILAGKTLFVETKARGKKPEPHQVVRIRQMRAAGADVRVIDTRELVDELITELITSADYAPEAKVG